MQMEELTAHGAKLLTKQAIKDEIERKRALELNESELQVLNSAFDAIRQAAAKGKYETCLVVGKGKSLPPEVLAKVQKIADKMTGLGYMTVVLTPVDSQGVVTLQINISWSVTE